MTDQFLSIYRSIDYNQIKDHPNILIAAGFWEETRFNAAKTCYKYLREVDDLIDDYKSTHGGIRTCEKQQFNQQVQDWLEKIRMQNQDDPAGHLDLINTIRKFHIPLWPVEYFAHSMLYDIQYDGFETFDCFIQYSQGASVAPAAIFLHLCGLRQDGDKLLPPLFDVREACTPCAIFSYIVHIIRDFKKDQLNNLNYFANDIMLRHNVDRKKLRAMAQGDPLTAGFREMMKEYCLAADEYRQRTWEVLSEIKCHLEPRYYLSLLIIFNLYLMVFERINCESGKFTTDELNPTTSEIQSRVYQTIRNFKAKEYAG